MTGVENRAGIGLNTNFFLSLTLRVGTQFDIDRSQYTYKDSESVQGRCIEGNSERPVVQNKSPNQFCKMTEIDQSPVI